MQIKYKFSFSNQSIAKEFKNNEISDEVYKFLKNFNY